MSKSVSLLREHVVEAARGIMREIEGSERERIAIGRLKRAVGALNQEVWRSDDAAFLVKDLVGLVKKLKFAKELPETAGILRQAEAFLGQREVSRDDPQPRIRTKTRLPGRRARS